MTKHITIIVAALLLVLSGHVHACSMQPPAPPSLFQTNTIVVMAAPIEILPANADQTDRDASYTQEITW